MEGRNEKPGTQGGMEAVEIDFEGEKREWNNVPGHLPHTYDEQEARADSADMINLAKNRLRGGQHQHGAYRSGF